jgi:glutamate racemase
MATGITHPQTVGMFDSGCGGLSILRSLRRDLPHVGVVYLADNRHLPYGDKTPEWLAERSLRLTQHLLDRGASLVLAACNTATAHTITALRERWPDTPFVGVEPGIKPAVAASTTRRIAILATHATLASERLNRLVGAHAATATILRHPCPGLADAIDRGDDGAIDRLLDDACEILRRADVDTVVLGCTHYPLVADRIAARLGPGVGLIDTADAVSRRVASQLPASMPRSGTARIDLLATGDPDSLSRAARRWIAPTVEAVGCSI